MDNGLSYAPDDQKLTNYRDEVLREKKAFEQAEQERIRLAEQQAAEEELRNRTGAVYVTDLSAELDEYGDLYISGSVFNQEHVQFLPWRLSLALMPRMAIISARRMFMYTRLYWM